MPYTLEENDEETTVYWFGERRTGIVGKKIEPQDYNDILQSLETDQLFEDPDFPADNSSIFFRENSTLIQELEETIEWKRPNEILAPSNMAPKFIEDGISRFDVNQGKIGDCWLVSAIACLAMTPSVFCMVVPSDNVEFDSEEYRGIFHFRFWRFGHWTDVCVDDRLPTQNGRMIFIRSASKQEFWSALVEKAYAKLHGSYEALEGGRSCDALQDFTAGLFELYESGKDEQEGIDVCRQMVKAAQKSSIMACSTSSPSMGEVHQVNGLVHNHAYSITAIRRIDEGEHAGVTLVRVRNPWGNDAEWKGDWSDESYLWDCVSEQTKRELGFSKGADGEFWMTYQDFKANFTSLEVTHLGEEFQKQVAKKWVISSYEGAWVTGVSAGGCSNYLDTTFHTNPQIFINVVDPDEDDDEVNCTVIIALMQKYQRTKGCRNYSIGIDVYRIENGEDAEGRLSLEFFQQNNAYYSTPTYSNSRELNKRLKCPPGTYCVIPSTFYPNLEGEFLLRVFSEAPVEMTNNEEGDGVEWGDDDEDEEEKWAWVSHENEEALEDGFVGGQEADGRPLILARGEVDGVLTPGKLMIEDDTAKVSVPWNGQEHFVTSSYEVLVAKPGTLSWIQSAQGYPHPRGVVGGTSEHGEDLYIGRVHYEGGVHPGKIHPRNETCYIAYGGEELSFKEYEILVF